MTSRAKRGTVVSSLELCFAVWVASIGTFCALVLLLHRQTTSGYDALRTRTRQLVTFHRPGKSTSRVEQSKIEEPISPLANENTNSGRDEATENYDTSIPYTGVEPGEEQVEELPTDQIHFPRPRSLLESVLIEPSHLPISAPLRPTIQEDKTEAHAILAEPIPLPVSALKQKPAPRSKIPVYQRTETRSESENVGKRLVLSKPDNYNRPFEKRRSIDFDTSSSSSPSTSVDTPMTSPSSPSFSKLPQPSSYNRMHRRTQSTEASRLFDQNDKGHRRFTSLDSTEPKPSSALAARIKTGLGVRFAN